MAGPQLFALPLAPFERDALEAVLRKAGLPSDDVKAPEILFWRFEKDDMPVGFGGFEVCGEDALLRSLVTLPPLRRRGIGAAMVAVIETEALARQLRGLYVVTTDCAAYFSHLGYVPCRREDVPAAVRASTQFASGRQAGAAVMVKPL